MTCVVRRTRSKTSLRYGSTGPSRSPRARDSRCRAPPLASGRGARAARRGSRAWSVPRRRPRSGSRTSPRTPGSGTRARRGRRAPSPHPARPPNAPRARAAARSPGARSARRPSPRGSEPQALPRHSRADPRSRRDARRAACAPRRALRAPRRSASAVARASVRRNEERDVVVAFLELDLELDPREEGRGRPKHQLVAARLEIACQLADAALLVGLAGRDDLPLLRELDPNAGGGAPLRGVQHVG